MSSYEWINFEKLKEIGNPMDVANALGIQVNVRSKGNIQMICPEHKLRLGREDRSFGSCTMTDTGYHCYACGGHGDFIKMAACVWEMPFESPKDRVKVAQRLVDEVYPEYKDQLVEKKSSKDIPPEVKKRKKIFEDEDFEFLGLYTFAVIKQPNTKPLSQINEYEEELNEIIPYIEKTTAEIQRIETLLQDSSMQPESRKSLEETIKKLQSRLDACKNRQEEDERKMFELEKEYRVRPFNTTSYSLQKFAIDDYEAFLYMLYGKTFEKLYLLDVDFDFLNDMPLDYFTCKDTDTDDDRIEKKKEMLKAILDKKDRAYSLQKKILKEAKDQNFPMEKEAIPPLAA